MTALGCLESEVVPRYVTRPHTWLTPPRGAPVAEFDPWRFLVGYHTHDGVPQPSDTLNLLTREGAGTGAPVIDHLLRTAAAPATARGGRVDPVKLPLGIAQLDLTTLADSGYDGGGQGIKTPFKQPAGGQVLAADNQAYNALHRATRCRGERGFALLTRRWRVPRRVSVSPRRIGEIAQATLVLTQIDAELRHSC